MHDRIGNAGCENFSGNNGQIVQSQPSYCDGRRGVFLLGDGKMTEEKVVNFASFFRSGKSGKHPKGPTAEEGLRLIKAFTAIESPGTRALIIAMVEKFVEKPK
jgi:hypothetical protein